MKKITGIIVGLLLVLTTYIGTIEVNAAVKINATTKTIYVGNKTTLKVTGTKKKAQWISSNKKVAMVTKKGIVTAKKAGTATVTAKIGKKKYTSKITVVTNQYTLIFNANGGTIYTKSKSITFNKTYGTLPTPQRNNYIFNGWYTAQTGGMKVSENTKATIRKNVIVYAQWEKTTDEIYPELCVTIDNDWILVGKQTQLNVAWNGPGVISYKSSSPDIATVNETGVVTALKPGNTVLRVEIIGGAKYYIPQANIILNVAGGEKQEYTYEIHLLNSYKIYAASGYANALLYIKTDNPDPSRMALLGSSVHSTAGIFHDVKYTGKSNEGFTPVEGGYLVFVNPSYVGKHTITIWEAYKGYSASVYNMYSPSGDYSKFYGTVTNTSITFDVFDMNEAYEEWVEDIISKSTNSGMTFHQKMQHIESYILANNRYPANSWGYDDPAKLLRLLSQYGAPWDVGILDSASSPNLLMDIASRLGCADTDMEHLTGYMHAYVLFTSDGETKRYCACPLPESNAFDPSNLQYFDFSKCNK